MLSRSINNPGDIKGYFGDETSKTVFMGNICNKEVVEHYKNKVPVQIKQVAVLEGSYIEGFIFTDEEGQQFPSTHGLQFENQQSQWTDSVVRIEKF